MKAGTPKPRFIVDENGKKSSVLLSMADYRKLMDAWEEVADAEEFAEARGTATNFITMDDLRCHLTKRSAKKL